MKRVIIHQVLLKRFYFCIILVKNSYYLLDLLNSKESHNPISILTLKLINRFKQLFFPCTKISFNLNQPNKQIDTIQ